VGKWRGEITKEEQTMKVNYQARCCCGHGHLGLSSMGDALGDGVR
jgi:hypothetical protein